MTGWGERGSRPLSPRLRFSQQLAELRNRYAAWHASMPPIPPDATASIPYGKVDLAQPS